MLLTVTAWGGGGSAGTSTKDGFAQAPQKDGALTVRVDATRMEAAKLYQQQHPDRCSPGATPSSTGPRWTTSWPPYRNRARSIVQVGVCNSGLHSREWPVEGMKDDYQDARSEPVARARATAEVCKGHGSSLPAVGIAFPTTRPSTVNVTLGMRDRAQVTQTVALQRSAVPPALWDDLRCQGLIRPDVLTTSGTQGTADRPAPDGRSAAHGDGTRGGSSRCR
ncbi:hypothetical protein [Streptomyces sp. NBC_00453]|uniref:hypothetical protein n=1 Tax=Streptomyces sp. NBC_00453 TaxID=2903653 RepID=UPI002E239D6C